MLEFYVTASNATIICLTAVAIVTLSRRISQARPPRYTTSIATESELPSVSVCIPARNEAHVLMDCLQKVCASTYQKLEIIVLDDSSADNTSALIKSFASEGVRFVQGKPLQSGWIGKNHALQGLLEEASGTYILFMDVDTRIEPQVVEHTVRSMLSQRLAMVSIVPRREDGWRASIVFSPLRYFWEILFNRALLPSTSSNAWMIQRSVLQKEFDGFSGIKDVVQPETQIATRLARDNRYRFLMSTAEFGVSFEKKWRSQLVTSVRLLYPLLSKNIFHVIGAILLLCYLLTPFLLLSIATSLPSFSYWAFSIAFLACGIQIVLYALYTKRMWRRGWLLGAIVWPLIVLQEIALIIASVILYRRHMVMWKGRPIQPKEVQS